MSAAEGVALKIIPSTMRKKGKGGHPRPIPDLFCLHPLMARLTLQRNVANVKTRHCHQELPQETLSSKASVWTCEICANVFPILKCNMDRILRRVRDILSKVAS